GRRIQGVCSAGRGQPALSVWVICVVEELILRRAPIDVVVLLGSVIENSGVAALRELPVERELEVSVLVTRDDVVDAPVLGERAVNDAPSGGSILSFVYSPPIECATIEQWPP